MLVNHISVVVVVVVVYDVIFQSFDGEKLDDYQGDGTGRKVKMPPFKSPSVVSTVSHIYIKENTRRSQRFSFATKREDRKKRQEKTSGYRQHESHYHATIGVNTRSITSNQ